MKKLFDTDWESELRPEDRATRKEDGQELEVVLLAGLQRLAREAGLIRQECSIQTPAPTMVQAVFSATFLTSSEHRPEATFVGTADAIVGGAHSNTQGKFASYPTAVAESRAEARCLRKALGIRTLSSEEIGFRDATAAIESQPDALVSDQVVKAIERLLDSRGIDAAEVLDAILDEDRQIFELNELTTAEGQTAMSWLNDKKKKKK